MSFTQPQQSSAMYSWFFNGVPIRQVQCNGYSCLQYFNHPPFNQLYSRVASRRVIRLEWTSKWKMIAQDQKARLVEILQVRHGHWSFPGIPSVVNLHPAMRSLHAGQRGNIQHSVTDRRVVGHAVCYASLLDKVLCKVLEGMINDVAYLMHPLIFLGSVYLPLRIVSLSVPLRISSTTCTVSVFVTCTAKQGMADYRYF